ncbi:MAG TPA: hypothetical protein VFV34_09330 [Blastocatellia bacterium]|nr:hypothetical protein [Blastocatellia bacterium]
MAARIKVEVRGRDGFWLNAFHVEWKDQFPDRDLNEAGPHTVLADPSWLDDMKRVGAQCFCTVVEAPAVPDRRRWIKKLLPQTGDD